MRRQALPEAEQQRITLQWGTLVQRLDRGGVPTMVREGVRSEQTQFAALQQQGRTVPGVRSEKGIDR